MKKYSFITARQQSCMKVMSSVVSVCMFTVVGGHVTNTRDAIGQSQSTWDPPTETSSNLFTWGPQPLPEPVQTCSLLASGQVAVDWKTSLDLCYYHLNKCTSKFIEVTVSWVTCHPISWILCFGVVFWEKLEGTWLNCLRVRLMAHFHCRTRIPIRTQDTDSCTMQILWERDPNLNPSQWKHVLHNTM